ncbi:MAG TPA: hydantoinase/carbamoylase family amidase [Actinomycetota bacterium]|jgi:allantoate deiminase|nr:hydantoinase/carbamoylase family amidase [Actinomycetota bacterium]
MDMEAALEAVGAERIAGRIEALAAIGRDPAGGITRLALTREEQAARELVASWLAPLGYQSSQDDAGNLHCRTGDGPRVLVGSHLDTVPQGGAYDGALGVVAAVEVAEALHQAGVTVPLHLVAWTGEEGVRFGTGLFGSASACGLLPEGAWERRDAGGRTVLEAAADLLGHPIRPESTALEREQLRAYLELHIEQASTLERRGCPLGVVTAIVGLYHGRAHVHGRADHAGATAMGERKDALAAAAECVLAVEEVSAAAAGGAIATVGEIGVLPGAQNVVPGSATFSLDVRSVSPERRADALAAILDRVERICTRRGLAWEVEGLGDAVPVPMTDEVALALASACERVGVAAPRLPSMAGHDAQNLAAIGVPTGMLFVRSTNGSHNPDEHADAADAALGAQALLLACAGL